jgi:hypothetical protein
MKVTLESTTEMGAIGVGGVEVPARIWIGQSEGGVPVMAFITRIGVPDGFDATELLELSEPPTTVVEAKAPCRRCSECSGQEHHWIEYVGYVCKHCEVAAPVELVERLMGFEESET